MSNLYAFFKHLPLNRILLVVVTTSVLMLSTACSQSAPPAALNPDPPNEGLSRLVDRSALPSRDASIEAKQQLIDRAKQQRAAPPRDTFGAAAKAVDQTAQGLGEDIRSAAQQTRQTMEEASDVIEDRSTDVLQSAQQKINGVIDSTNQFQQALEDSSDALEDRASDVLENAQRALNDA